MRLTDIFERKRVKGENGEQQFRTAMKWSKDGGRMVSARGATQEEADAACLEKIRNRFRGAYTPLCLRFRGAIMLIWRNGDEWAYGSLGDDTQPSENMCADWTSREIVERAARRHLAMNTWDEQEEMSEILVDSEDQKWFGNWAREQKAEAAKCDRLLKAGWTKEEAVKILSRSQIDPQRIEQLGDPWQLLHEITPEQ